jgi:hypothetical protein
MKMYKAENGRYWIDVMLPFQSILVRRKYDRNRIKRFRDLYPHKKIFLIHFEEPLRNSMSEQDVLQDASLFDLIFTSNRNIVNKVSHAYWSPLAECWTNGSMPSMGTDRTAEARDKKFCISFLGTSKQMGYGGFYDIRKYVWEHEKEIHIPTEFLDSREHSINDGHPFLPTSSTFQTSDKIHLYKSMFNFCPENADDENFSQRLIDCFINKTIPIYRGYKNIHEHFNIDGIIYVNDGPDAIEKINQLTPDYYHSKLSAIEDNYRRCIQNNYHLSPGDRISILIMKIYENK